MGWLDNVRNELVGLDTTPLIYLIENNPIYADFVTPFFDMADEGEIKIVTSTMTLLEVLVHPIKRNDIELIQRYRQILLESEFSVIDLSREIAEEAAHLRAVYGLRTPDAIQVATAIYSKASFFLTNDKRLSSIKEIKVLVIDTLLEQDKLQGLDNS